MMVRILVAVTVLLAAVGTATAGVDETYVRPSEMPSLSTLYNRLVGKNAFSKSYALVIGVGDYDAYSKLGAPAQDARRVSEFLRDDAGFDYIVTLTDEKAAKVRIESLMETVFPKLVRENDRFLLYFSGHGATRAYSRGNKRGYLVLKASHKDAWDEMIDMPRVMEYAQNLESARHNLFILDACFSGLAALQIKGSARDKAVERLSQPAHHLVTAGVEDEESYASNNESLFTKAFLRAARGDSRASSRSDVVSLSEIMLEVNQSLDELRASEPGIKMSPHQYLVRAESNPGEFFFLKKGWTPTSAPARPITELPSSAELREGGDGKSVRSPNRVAIGPDTVLFDQSTGRPLLWFVKNSSEYDFFDGPGFHPRTGQELSPFTRNEARDFLLSISNKEEDNRREKERLELERRERERRDSVAREALLEKQEQERLIREAEAARASEAGQRCDDLAANPNDRNKVGQGASFGALKAQAAEAVKACDLAMKQKPSELRFKYQLARALQFSDRSRSFALHRELVGQGYGASYDNLGWMYYTDRKDKAQAIALFRQGIQVGDVDSMVSLAELVDRAEVNPVGGAETKIELCRRAAELGHVGARQCYQVEVAKQEQAEKDRVQQLEQQKMMIQLMGTIIQGATRR
ncbi:caspase family protein [Rhodopseudomonas palustris]|uniref:caspase family protein n=1 Tax=Rhodopseudomonas palustris TaxID=1076 RepID=UPI000D1B9861|nr:caspase family protein [Rhodopseudomonas palustris]AVT82746.1 hypothetical protein RPYSC3_38860 [Rhodopseudomonas palustris]